MIDKSKEAFKILTKSMKHSKNKFIMDGNTVRKLRKDVQKFNNNCIEEIDKFLLTDKLYEDRNIKPVPYKPEALLHFYPCLRLKKKFHIESIFGSNPGPDRSSSKGFVFIVRDGRKFPMPQTEKQDEELLDFLTWGEALSKKDHLPRWVHQNVASYVEGDGSPLSYFQSSIFIRDVYELGATWHDLDWSVNTLLVSSNQIPKDEKWTWHVPKPDKWLPTVWKDEDDYWNVTFYTHDDMKSEIIFHDDIYRKGYDLAFFRFTIASSYQAKMF